MKAKQQILELVQVTWLDAATVDAWHDVETASGRTPELCWSVGWMARKTKNEVVLCPSIGPKDATCFGSLVIPRSSIKEIRPLRVSRTRTT